MANMTGRRPDKFVGRDYTKKVTGKRAYKLQRIADTTLSEKRYIECLASLEPVPTTRKEIYKRLNTKFGRQYSRNIERHIRWGFSDYY